MLQPLHDKVALVTGASKGIGAESAVQLAAAGAAVVVNYAADQAGADRTVAAIVAAGGRAAAVQADVSKPADVDRLFAAADRFAGGKLDVLVNSAAVYGMMPLDQVTPEHFNQEFGLNVLGLILVTQAAVKRFGDAGGSIVNVSALASAKGFPGLSVYSATKGAVDALTRSLASELGPRRIRVNAVNPGLVRTEGTAGFPAEFEAHHVASVALGRIGRPADIAAVVTFLASPASGWLTGETLFATGGVR